MQSALIAAYVLHFMTGFVLALPFGITSYWIFHGKSDWLQFFQVVLSVPCLVVLPVIVLLNLVYGGLLLLLLLAMSTAQSVLEVRLNPLNAARHNWWRSFFAHTCSLVLGTLFLLGNGQLFPPAGPFETKMGFGAGLLLVVFSISIFHWMIRGSRLRPGMDRALNEDEKL